MTSRILIVPDKFKGTLSAPGVAAALARGWRQVRPDDELELLPMSDGGEGFGEAMGRLLGAELQTVPTVDAAHQPIAAHWWWAPKIRTAVLESAMAIGLTRLPAGKFRPQQLDTYGLGALMQSAAEAGAGRCLVGLGGSATNDGGFGLARALGWQFLDAGGAELRTWTELYRLERVEPPGSPVRFEALTVAVDVQNPLLGPSGCTRVYGPQKGLQTVDLEIAERCLGRLAAVLEKQLGIRGADRPGAGAAGGLGFGLRCFAGAQLESGFELFSRHADLAGRIQSARLVLTGEGRLDEQTLMGKGVGALAAMCQKWAVPCVVFAGAITGAATMASRFHRMWALSPDIASRERALAEPAACLEQAAATAARAFDG